MSGLVSSKWRVRQKSVKWSLNYSDLVGIEADTSYFLFVSSLRKSAGIYLFIDKPFNPNSGSIIA